METKNRVLNIFTILDILRKVLIQDVNETLRIPRNVIDILSSDLVININQITS